MQATLVAIPIADQAGGPLRSLRDAGLLAGGGLAVDRNCDRPDPRPEQEGTLLRQHRTREHG